MSKPAFVEQVNCVNYPRSNVVAISVDRLPQLLQRLHCGQSTDETRGENQAA